MHHPTLVRRRLVAPAIWTAPGEPSRVEEAGPGEALRERFPFHQLEHEGGVPPDSSRP
jgi:hypothetical protein